MLWIAGRNPVAQDPDTNSTREALRAIDTVIVCDQRITATAELEDYLLPVATFFLLGLLALAALLIMIGCRRLLARADNCHENAAPPAIASSGGGVHLP